MTSLLPANATELERAVEQLVVDQLGDIDTPLRDVWSPENCPEHLLPWLAWALSIDSWDANWPVHVRRARIAAAIAVQRRKGTAQSVIDVVASFGGNVVFREWFEQDPPGTPHTFQLSISLGGQSGGAPSAGFISQVIDEVARTKPVRSHFDFTVATSARGAVGILGAARAMIFARLSGAAEALPDFCLLLSGDQTDGDDLLLLSGDQTDGDDLLLLNLYS